MIDDDDDDGFTARRGTSGESGGGGLVVGDGAAVARACASKRDRGRTRRRDKEEAGERVGGRGPVGLGEETAKARKDHDEGRRAATGSRRCLRIAGRGLVAAYAGGATEDPPFSDASLLSATRLDGS